jgi:two-component system, chemotaxis family, chemotaxis protein CheY
MLVAGGRDSFATSGAAPAGVGARFPRSECRAQMLQRHSNSVLPMSVKPRGPVLLVEDHADFREAMAALLEASDYTVVTASDGDEALGCLRDGIAPCLIVLDLDMPRTDGREFRSAQTHDATLAAIPTIICSGRRDLKESAARLGIDGYFEKGGGFDEFLALVARHCLTS